MGPTPVAVATASAGRSASHASLVAGGSALSRQPHTHPGAATAGAAGAAGAGAAGAAGLPVFRYAPDRRRASAILARDADARVSASSSCCGRGAEGAWEESDGTDWRSDPAAAAANLTVAPAGANPHPDRSPTPWLYPYPYPLPLTLARWTWASGCGWVASGLSADGRTLTLTLNLTTDLIVDH